MAASAGAVRAGGAYVEIFAKDGAFQQAMVRVQNKLKAVGTAMRQMGTSLSIGGAALGAPFVIAAREAANFTLAMAQVRANTNATDEQFAKLNKAAREMGVAMGQSPTETASAMSELAKAGLDAEGVMASIGPVLALAASDNMELARAVEVVVGTMSQFGMSTKDFASISDRLQAAANASVTSVDLIGESLSYVGPQAQAAGQSFDDVAAALGTLAQGGIKGSMAGTQLARVLEAMVDDEAKFNQLGVSVRDASGNLRPFMDVLRDLNVATGNMNNADKLQKFMDIFDIRGARAAITLSGLGKEFDRILGTIQNSSGAAAKKATDVLNSFGGAVKRLNAMFADLKIAVITSMGETATSAVRGLGTVLKFVTQLIERNPTLVATVAGVAAGMFTLGAAMIAGGLALQVMAKGLGVLRAGLSILPALFTPVGASLGLLAAGVGAAIVVARQLSPAFRKETDAIIAAIMRLDFGAAWEVMNLSFAIALTQMAAKADSVLRTVQGFFEATGAFIGDKLVEGLDRFMGLFGADIITMQTALQKLGVYLRAAFDWEFAVNGMSGALRKIESQAEEARRKSPTADARAEGRAAGRKDAAERRQEEADKAAKGWTDTIDTLRQEAEQARRKAAGETDKPATQPTSSTGGAVVPPDRGVMPVGPGAGEQEKSKNGNGIGQTLGGFGFSGEGLAIGPELNKLEDYGKQTAGNTAIAAQALQAISGGGGGAAMSLSDKLPPTVQAANAGRDVASGNTMLAETFTKGFATVTAAIEAHMKVSAAGNQILSRIEQKLPHIGGSFA
jgi:TP901 family phage tail tape measure protein